MSRLSTCFLPAGDVDIAAGTAPTGTTSLESVGFVGHQLLWKAPTLSREKLESDNSHASPERTPPDLRHTHPLLPNTQHSSLYSSCRYELQHTSRLTSTCYLSRNATMMHVMLSPPIPAVFFGSTAMHLPKISSQMVESFILSFMPWRTKSPTSSLDMQSQTPSQAITINSSSDVRGCRMMSGCAVTTCSSGGRRRSVLYLRSPMDRERFRFPFTL
mmetsp:Transcript_59903/g.122953  ORF Transcript_59903/g.122953 Transcript_59903/m.122953 type:complete len:216 (-) Transcript_59903:423-1070(-)